MSLPLYPFDGDLCIGTVTEVGPTYAKGNLPLASLPEAQWHHGRRQGRGEVGDFVLIEVSGAAIFGRIVNVRLPEKERLTVEPSLGNRKDSHPVGTIQLLSTLSLESGAVQGGIAHHPRLGSRIYAAHPRIVKWIAEASGKSTVANRMTSLNIASIAAADGTVLNIPPERIFGRHCAVLGATGGGKSWTVARLIEQAGKLPHAKVLLLDATGEFHTLSNSVRHVHLGGGTPSPASSQKAVFPYWELTEGDLFALFKPSGQTQAPKLRGAMKTLKLARYEPALAPKGLVKKANQLKKPFNDAYRKHATTVHSPQATFEIKQLCSQIIEDCVWPTGKVPNPNGGGKIDDPTRWGDPNESEKSYCITLVTRIEDMVSSIELAAVLQPGTEPALSGLITDFLADSTATVLRVSLKHLSFTHNTREIVANAIGRHLLTLARDDAFKTRPLVVFLDEAHQFLDKQLGDENARFPLDSFDLIAKEGRKYGLTICIATQRPRDIPEGVLSQMGTLFVHRLINDKDREVVERASGEIDRSAAEFLPTLSPGQAVIIGVDFPIPLTVQIASPEAHPDSQGPDYQSHWCEETAMPEKSLGAGQSLPIGGDSKDAT
jgi:hypothetical protein